MTSRSLLPGVLGSNWTRLRRRAVSSPVVEAKKPTVLKLGISQGSQGPTRSEEGCINDLHQSREDPSRFMFYENWVSQEDLDQHLQMPYLKAFREKAGDLLAEPASITLHKIVVQSHPNIAPLKVQRPNPLSSFAHRVSLLEKQN